MLHDTPGAFLSCTSAAGTTVTGAGLRHTPSRKLMQGDSLGLGLDDSTGSLDDVGSKLKSFWGAGNNQAAASAMATAGARGAGKATAAAEASADAAASGAIGGLAETFASAAATSVAGTASVMAKAAAKSKSRGQAQWEAFAKSQARAFAEADARGSLDAYAKAVAKAINEGGEPVMQTYGVAFAKAIASGGPEGQALAKATAIAFCEGGSMASAFAEAWSEALSRDKNGCLVLTKARAIAIARCTAAGAFSEAKTKITKKVLGQCKLRKRWVAASSSWADFDDDNNDDK